MEVVGEAILSALLAPLVEKLTSSELLKFARKRQLDKELKKWESKLLEIRLVLNHAEEEQITNPAVKTWLTKLQHLAYDVEDILDEFATEARRSNLRAESSTRTAERRVSAYFTVFNPSGYMHNMKTGSKLKEVTLRLQEIVTEKDGLALRTNGERRSRRGNERLPTSSLVEESIVYGRKEDKDAIIELLASGETSDSNFSVIAITGMGGVGKTTLAQLVYNDERVKFDCKAWVCVSDDFDIFRITKDILQEKSEAKDLNSLQVKLKEKLSEKKFLIILDDVWSKNYNAWTSLRSPFAAGKSGSKIILTTRDQDIPSIMGALHTYCLKELSSADCLSLFAQHALDAKNFDAHPNLKEIAKEIVRKCKGLPLAAKTLGGLLRGKRYREDWEDILNSKIWDLPPESGGILPALMLSYHHLPSHLKQCFTYCAIFPKDYEFERKELVLLWMAEGFLQNSKKKRLMEDLGDEYFRDLLSRSFFQQSSGDKSRYVMHDLISDLAQFVGREICYNLDDDLEEAKLANIRYSSFSAREYDVYQRFVALRQMSSLRTFLPFSAYQSYISKKVVHGLVLKLKALRVLSLAGYTLWELPCSVGGLKHLRYLNLFGSDIERLPESLTELFNLQTLILCECSSLIKLPAGLGNLINMHHLDMRGTYNLREMPPRMGDLTNLITLTKFIVGKDDGLGIRELMKVSSLRGELRIEGLRNVANVQDAELANLKEKDGLDQLDLVWNDEDDLSESQNENNQQQVLNALRPHQNIQKLSVEFYGGIRFPTWVGDPSFNSLSHLKLWHCRKMTSLPPLGQLPSLRDLNIKGLDGIKEVGAEFYGDGSSCIHEFPSLQTLTIEDMSSWEQCSWTDGHDDEDAGKFPNLCELSIVNCPMLVGKLPRFLPSLKRLYISDCPQLRDLPRVLPSLEEMEIYGCGDFLLRNVSDLVSLTTLTIQRVSGLVSLPELLMQSSLALEELTIRTCSELEYLWGDGTNLDGLHSLKSLDIDDCHQLVSLVEGEEGIMPCNLKALSISGCSTLEKLPNGLQNLTCLNSLDISFCEQLASLIEGEEGVLPFNLEDLKILNCYKLDKLPKANGLHNFKSLCIENCLNLVSFPATGLLRSIMDLRIFGCKSLESLSKGTTGDGCNSIEMSHLKELSIGDSPLFLLSPIHKLPHSLEVLSISRCPKQILDFLNDQLLLLTELYIGDCSELESFPERGLLMPSLVTLTIRRCENLRSLPNQMHNLTVLRYLLIVNCGGLVSFPEGGFPPNLTSLEIWDCNNIRQPMSEWGLHGLTSLRRLEIFGTSPSTDMVSFPDEDGLLLPTSLTSLFVGGFQSLKSISKGLQNLTCLETLGISKCPKLRSLPKKGLPATLGDLRIKDCPQMKERCLKKYWPIIVDIPQVIIDLQDVRELKFG